MTRAERELLIRIALALSNRLTNAGGTGFKFHADRLKEQVERVREEDDPSYEREG